jgi:hypothetical protein
MDDNSNRLSERNDFQITVAPATLRAGEITEIPIRIESSEIGFQIDVYLGVFGEFDGYFVAQQVLPELTINDRPVYGVHKRLFLDKQDTTITVSVEPYLVFETGAFDFDVYIAGNNSKSSGFSEVIGVKYASSEFLMDYDAPVFESFDYTVGEVLDKSIALTINPFVVSSNVYNYLYHGLCYSKSPLPTIDDINISRNSDDIVYQGSKLTYFWITPIVLRDLEPDTKYYIRAFASNGKYSYSEQFEVTTRDQQYMVGEYLELNQSYLADDNLTVTMNSIKKDVLESYTEYTINYTLRNNTTDQKLDEGSFAIFSLGSKQKESQYGFFGSLFPGESKTRSYKFQVLNTVHFDLVEYNSGFFDNVPNRNKLKWDINK